MSNYLRAEWYKLRCRKYLWITALIVLAAETLMFAAYGILHDSQAGMDFHTGWTNLLPLLWLGFFMPLLTGDMVFADQYKNGTLKNELSFGLSRGMIYWGKLLAQTILSLALCALFVGYYFAGCWLLPHDPALDAQALEHRRQLRLFYPLKQRYIRQRDVHFFAPLCLFVVSTTDLLPAL